MSGYESRVLYMVDSNLWSCLPVHSDNRYTWVGVSTASKGIEPLCVIAVIGAPLTLS